MAAGGAAVIQLQLTGNQRVMAGLSAVQTKIGSLAATTKQYTRDAEEGGKRTWLMNQALFTMRRYAYAATLGLTGLASAAVVMGLKFNASMEMNQVAFTQFLGSAKAASTELQYLYDLAKYTPFEFSNVTDAARRFLAFGFTIKETNRNLATIGDTVAAFGGGGAQIERMVTVFGQIRASGRLLGQDLLQLEQQGIPVIDILVKKLAKYGVTRAMLSRPGALQIPAEIGIPALMQGMQERFKGASALQAKTFTGQLSTLHDSVSQVMGAITSNAFEQGRKGVLPGLNKMFGQMGDLARKQKNKLSMAQVFGIIGRNYSWAKPFLDMVRVLIDALKPLGTILKNLVLPTIVLLALIIQHGLLPPLRLAIWALNKFARFSWLLVPVLTYVIALITVEKTVLLGLRTAEILAAGATRILEYQMALLGRTIQFLDWIQKINIKTTRLWMALTKGYIVLTGKQGFQSMTKFEKSLAKIGRTMRKTVIPAIKAGILWTKRWVAEMWAAMIENPIGIVIAVIVLLVAGLIILYFKWKWFHNLVNNTARLMWKHWKIAAAVLFLFGGVFAVVAFIIAKHWKTIWGWIQKVWSLFKGLYGWIKSEWGTISRVLLAPFMPLIMTVRTIIHVFRTAVGWVKSLVGWISKIHIPGWMRAIGRAAGWVGSQIAGGATSAAYAINRAGATPGTALAGVPAGGGAIPIAGSNAVQKSIQQNGGRVPPWDVTVHSNVHIDGKKVGESVAKHRQNKTARR